MSFIKYLISSIQRNRKYLVRLDDACPYMNRSKWEQVEHILDKYDIKPMVGIIPHNKDAQTMVEAEDPFFWQKAIVWQEKGWSIALHGYNHCYETTSGGINPIHHRSEFAGLPLKQQKEKLVAGYRILSQKGLKPSYFFAPSHTFDAHTIEALKETTPIRLISDDIGRYPYQYDSDVVLIPCQMGRFRDIPWNGYWTFCFHPNDMSSEAMEEFETFIAKHHEKFIDYSHIPTDKPGEKRIVDKLMSHFYFMLRRIKR